MSEREREKISSIHEAASAKGPRGPSAGNKGIKAWEPEQEETPRLQTAEVGDAGKGFRTRGRNLPRERRVVRPYRLSEGALGGVLWGLRLEVLLKISKVYLG